MLRSALALLHEKALSVLSIVVAVLLLRRCRIYKTLCASVFPINREILLAPSLSCLLCCLRVRLLPESCPFPVRLGILGIFCTFPSALAGFALIEVAIADGLLVIVKAIKRLPDGTDRANLALRAVLLNDRHLCSFFSTFVLLYTV
jgi:hypothetical protein